MKCLTVQLAPKEKRIIRAALAQAKGETIETLERIEAVVQVALKEMRGDGDVQLPKDIHQTMQIITSGFHKVLSKQQRARTILEMCEILEVEP